MTIKKTVDKENALNIIKAKRDPHLYILEAFEEDHWNDFEGFTCEDQVLAVYDEWLENTDLSYERQRAERYMASRGYPDYFK